MSIELGEAISHLYGDSEREIVNELPYTLQGASTESFKWLDRDCALLLPVVSLPLLQTTHELAEPAILYRWLREKTSRPPNGLVTQALYNSIDEELQQYLIFVGALEKRVRARSEITLSDCVVMLHEPTLALRLLYKIANESDNLVGGQILSLLFRYTHHGNRFVEDFCRKLLTKSSLPFTDFLTHWVGSGTLNDPYGEFFVQVEDVNSRWSGRFAFLERLVPESMAMADAKRAFDVGKALYFLRSLCQDESFVTRSSQIGVDLIHHNFQSVIEHVNEQLAARFELKIHLKALRDYMLLNKGDFVETLLRESNGILSQPAETLVRHQLTTALEAAIYTSNAQFDPAQVLSQLDARVLALGELGWQVFTIDYQVPSPLDVIVDNRAMRLYRQIFNFLWRVRYASFALSTVWRAAIMATRGNLKTAIREQNIDDEWRLCLCEGWQALSHFTNELQLFIYTEVIEGAWKTMSAKLEKLATLDEIIDAHYEYLTTIKSRAMFGTPETLADLHMLIDWILSFCDSAASMHAVVANHQVDRQRDTFDAIRDQLLMSRGGFEETLTSLLNKLDDDNQSFSTRLNFNNYYLR